MSGIIYNFQVQILPTHNICVSYVCCVSLKSDKGGLIKRKKKIYCSPGSEEGEQGIHPMITTWSDDVHLTLCSILVV